MAVYGYARVSTLMQAREGESLEAQSRQIHAYAVSKGLELSGADIFVEAGVSGGVEFQLRPEGGRLYDLVQKGDLIVFPKLDRAFRNTRNALNVLHDLKERGVHIHFIDLGGDVTGNGIGAIVFTILSAFATFEKDRIATRIREVKQIKKAQGKFTGGRRAFGYQVIDLVKIPMPDAKRIIAEMKALRDDGMSFRSIEKWLGEKKQLNISAMGVRHILNEAH
jgi:putative DNA-invertase from lambdoid prophage Rac